MLVRTHRGWGAPRRRMNRFSAGLPRHSRWGVAPEYPAMNVWTAENNAVLTATFENGVLNVVLPRAEADLPRKIAVQSG